MVFVIVIILDRIVSIRILVIFEIFTSLDGYSICYDLCLRCFICQIGVFLIVFIFFVVNGVMQNWILGYDVVFEDLDMGDGFVRVFQEY